MMVMPRFFVEELTETTVIYGADAGHISRSLRMKAGEGVVLCDGRGNEAQGVIVSLSSDAVTVRLGEVSPSQSEPSCEVALFIALPKGDKLDFIVQKAVELGASSIHLVITSRCISRPKGDVQGKLNRLNKIVFEAAGQCGRGKVPLVKGMLSFDEALYQMQQFDNAFTLYEGECPSLRSSLPKSCRSLALFTGCEGGFSSEEVLKIKEHGILLSSLGKRILRCETAPLAALSAVMFALGEMD